MEQFLIAEESGQSTVEYSMILAFVSIVAVSLLVAIGQKVIPMFSNTNDAFDKK